MIDKTPVTVFNNDLTSSVRFIALVVPDLRIAEEYYRRVFDMDLIGREAMLGGGQWYTLPFDKGWNEAEAAGVDLGMLALRKDNFVLALFKGDGAGKQVYAIGIAMPAEEIARVRLRLVNGEEIEEDEPNHLSFRDYRQITWQVSGPGTEFRTSGDFADRWLKI